jgi:phage shock protein PspC (stress-responsive transcriptional regulator)
MKSTIKVSISGIAFNLDNDAYGCLKNYLDRIERIFAGKEGGREIIEDIEVRIAELFSARIQSPEQIITLPTVAEVVATVGTADDIADNDEETTAFAPESVKASERKRLFRDIDHHVLGGVCSGLGNYFGIDRVLVRLAFVAAAVFVLFFPHYGGAYHFFKMVSSAAVLIYIALWIAMPAARTMKEKMTMRRETITPSNTARREEEEDYQKAAHASDLGNVLGKIIRVTCRIIAGIMLAFVAFIALTLIIALPFGFITGNVVLGELGALDIANYLRTYTFIPLWLAITLLTLLVCLPLIALIYLISKALFKFKTKIRFGLILLITWLVVVLSVVGLSIYVASDNPDFPEQLFSENFVDSEAEERTFEPFTSLSVSGNFNVIAVPAETNYLLIEANRNALPYIRTDVENKRMRITLQNFGWRNRYPVRIYVYYRDWNKLEQLRLSGASKFTCPDTLRTAFSANISGASNARVVVNNGRSEIALSGASNLDVAGYTAEFTAEVSGASKLETDITGGRLKVAVNGVSKANLLGAAACAAFEVSGAAKISAGHCSVDTLKVKATGSGKIDVQANNHLQAHASGATLITYSGNPKTSVHTSGAAKVEHVNKEND